MHDLTQLRRAAREVFDEALRAVDPISAMHTAVHIEKSTLIVGQVAFDITAREIYAIAIGKAAARMAVGLNQILGTRLSAGVLSSSDFGNGNQELGMSWKIFRGGHPEPNEASLAAARACLRLLETANQARALVIFLISGGGSAMIEAPASDEVSLSDLQAANKLLVNSGASISEVNAVRRAFSAVKGGKLAARAPNCDQITLIVSDVPDGEEYNVASGPTIAPDRMSFVAREVIDGYQLRGSLPSSIVRTIDKSDRVIAGSALRSQYFVLLSNNDARRAAAEAAGRRGFNAEIASDISDQAITQGCTMLLERLDALRVKNSDNRAVCLISGGEFRCPARGGGLGGRNLESVLRLALLQARSKQPKQFVTLCAGTDGIDGNSTAAGAIIDGTTLERAHALGLDAEISLERSDSHSFFAALGDAITTGPTGTNVRDLRILLAG